MIMPHAGLTESVNSPMPGPGVTRTMVLTMRLERIAQLVSATPILAGLSDGHRERLVQCAEEARFTSGQHLARNGHPADRFFILHAGSVKLELEPGAGLAIGIETFSPPEVVGWSWLLPPYRWHFDVRALDDVHVIAVDGATLRVWMDADPAFGYAILRPFASVMVSRLQATRLRLLGQPLER
jgi:CRP-like cAMP-binding protein